VGVRPPSQLLPSAWAKGSEEARIKERGRPAAELRPGEELERHGWRSWTWALAGPVKIHPSLTEEDEEETLLI